MLIDEGEEEEEEEEEEDVEEEEGEEEDKSIRITATTRLIATVITKTTKI